MTTTTLTPYSGGRDINRARSWATLPDDERRRRAVEACHDHDVETLCQIADAWLTLHGRAGATASPHTRAAYQRGVRLLLVAWTQENVLHPRRNAGALWLREMEEAGRAPATVKVRLAGARALYAALRWSGATEADPFKDVRPATDKTAAKDKRAPYEPDELTRLLTTLDETVRIAQPAARTMARYDRVLILLGSQAGLRASEMIDLRWSEVDLLRRRVVVQHGKGGKRRQVVMSSSLAAALDAIPPAMRGAFVLPYRTRGAAWYRLKRLTDRAGIDAHGLHRLRHSAGTRMMRETGNLQEVAELLGHAQLDTARVYAQWADQTQRETVGKW